MGSFVNKVSEKSEKLSKEQLLSVINNMCREIEELSASNEDLHSIFNSVSSGLILVDKDYYVVQTNKAAESLLGIYSSEGYRNALCEAWSLVKETEIADFLKKCAEKKITNAQEDFTISTEGGSVRFINVMVSPFFHKSKLSGTIITVNDVTDSKNHEILVHRMENMASLTNLAAGMAHEIKNPLGAISIHIQLVQRALEKARENADTLPARKFVEDHIDVVNEEIDHLNSLVMDFLFAVRPVNANLELKDPVNTIKNVADFFTPEFNRFNIELRTSFDESGQRILIDEKLFREIMMNLSQNALAAIKSQFPECREERAAGSVEDYSGLFQIMTRIKDGKYLILVSDNGCGMSSETLSKVFEPYFTTKANGTGLGMTMVYKIIKEFHGEITAKSTEGKGTQFVMSFPVPTGNKKLLK